MWRNWLRGPELSLRVLVKPASPTNHGPIRVQAFVLALHLIQFINWASSLKTLIRLIWYGSAGLSGLDQKAAPTNRTRVSDHHWPMLRASCCCKLNGIVCPGSILAINKPVQFSLFKQPNSDIFQIWLVNIPISENYLYPKWAACVNAAYVIDMTRWRTPALLHRAAVVDSVSWRCHRFTARCRTGAMDGGRGGARTGNSLLPIPP